MGVLSHKPDLDALLAEQARLPGRDSCAGLPGNLRPLGDPATAQRRVMTTSTAGGPSRVEAGPRPLAGARPNPSLTGNGPGAKAYWSTSSHSFPR